MKYESGSPLTSSINVHLYLYHLYLYFYQIINSKVVLLLFASLWYR